MGYPFAKMMKQNFSWILILPCLLMISSCTTSKKTASGPELFLYSMHQGPCFGFCPVYDLFVYESGKVVWDARRFNKTNGKFEKQLSDAELKTIKEAFKKANLFKMQDEYPTEVADLPTITLSETKKGKVKTVKGNEKMPESFEHCVELMRQLTQNGPWLMVEQYQEDEPQRNVQKEEYIYDEIIIEPNAGTSLPKWFRDNANYGIHLIRKISPDLNLWLIGYDKNQLEPKMMLDMLKKDSSIKTAEFNKKTEERN